MKVFLKLKDQNDEVKEGVKVIIDIGTKLLFYYTLNVINGPSSIVEKSEIEHIGIYIADNVGS